MHDTQNFKKKKKDTVWVDLDEEVFHFLKKHSDLITKEFRETVANYKDYIEEKNASLDL